MIISIYLKIYIELELGMQTDRPADKADSRPMKMNSLIRSA
jgi:hypothetical protein